MPNYNPYKELFKKSNKELCGKTYPQTNYYTLDDDSYFGHDCCEKNFSCTELKGHEGNHSDESHYNKDECPFGGDKNYFHPDAASWAKVNNPLTEVFGK